MQLFATANAPCLKARHRRDAHLPHAGGNLSLQARHCSWQKQMLSNPILPFLSWSTSGGKARSAKARSESTWLLWRGDFSPRAMNRPAARIVGTPRQRNYSPNIANPHEADNRQFVFGPGCHGIVFCISVMCVFSMYSQPAVTY